MSFAYHYLATNPAERDRLIGDPDLLTFAVEEFIRFAGSIHGIPRTVAKEVELNGCTFSPGESVIVNYAAANRDEMVFPDAARCILDRRENRHLGFGAGVHRCLGPIWLDWSSRSAWSGCCPACLTSPSQKTKSHDFTATRSPADSARSPSLSRPVAGPPCDLPGRAVDDGQCRHRSASAARPALRGSSADEIWTGGLTQAYPDVIWITYAGPEEAG